MQIVIVEDEANIRHGMQRTIEKRTAHHVVATAADGQEGLDVIREYQPDVIITDIKMPGMDGLTMLEILQNEGMETHALILTGYSDFEFARTSLRLKAEDYLLKPVGVDVLINALDKIDAKIRQNQEEGISAQQLIFAILGTNSGRDSAVPHLKRALRATGGERISLVLVRFCGEGEDPAERLRAETEEVLKNVFFTLCGVYTLPSEREILLILRDEYSAAYIRSFCLHQLASVLRFEGELMISYGELSDLSEFAEKIGELESYFRYGFGMDKPVFLNKQIVEDCAFEEIVYPVELEQQARKYIRIGDFNEVWNTGLQFEKEIMYSEGTPETIKEYTLRLMTSALQSLEITEADKRDAFHMMISDLMNVDTRLQLIERCQKIWIAVVETQTDSPIGRGHQTSNEAVRAVVELIHRNYMENITLPEVAQSVGFTPEHLSRLFSREMGITFSGYLTECRRQFLLSK